jgi:hypothetical protein
MVTELVVFLHKGPDCFEERVVGFLLWLFGDSQFLFELTCH